MTEPTDPSNAAALARSAPRPARATSIKDRKCARCAKTIPAGEPHVYDGDQQRWHAECQFKENK